MYRLNLRAQKEKHGINVTVCALCLRRLVVKAEKWRRSHARLCDLLQRATAQLRAAILSRDKVARRNRAKKIAVVTSVPSLCRMIVDGFGYSPLLFPRASVAFRCVTPWSIHAFLASYDTVRCRRRRRVARTHTAHDRLTASRVTTVQVHGRPFANSRCSTIARPVTPVCL